MLLVFLGSRALRISECERSTEYTNTSNRRSIFVEPAAAFRSAISSMQLDYCETCEREELEVLSRASVCAASRILTSVASSLWSAPTREGTLWVAVEEEVRKGVLSYLFVKGDDFHVLCDHVLQ